MTWQRALRLLRDRGLTNIEIGQLCGVEEVTVETWWAFLRGHKSGWRPDAPTQALLIKLGRQAIIDAGATDDEEEGRTETIWTTKTRKWEERRVTRPKG